MKKNRRDFIRDYGMMIGGLIVAAPLTAFAQTGAGTGTTNTGQGMGTGSGTGASQGQTGTQNPPTWGNQPSNQPPPTGAPGFGRGFYQAGYYY